jgi:CBS domain containing-hemolysin-like protein
MQKNKLKSLLVPPDITIKQAMQNLDESAQQTLFVKDEHLQLLGTVTDGDIRRAIIGGSGFIDITGCLLNEKFYELSV